VNDRRYVFHFRPKPNIWPEKYLALGSIPKPKPNVKIYVKIGGTLHILQTALFFSLFDRAKNCHMGVFSSELSLDSVGTTFDPK
jgi:hypothetical protein